ncbi:hypothetical protein ABZ128_03365 [Streptomyces sp. NPDC006326]|uniref:hypothetical protein n=1 Tax=Streptomyces sp. NPDC006326 TaxID=3156752 RepID=UPI0033A3128E
MSLRAATEAAVIQAEDWLQTGTWKATDADAATAKQLLAQLDWLNDPAQDQAAAPLTGRLNRLREALAALAVATATSPAPMNWFLGQCAAALAPAMRWHPDDNASHGNTLTPTNEEIADAEHAMARLRDLLASLHQN